MNAAELLPVEPNEHDPSRPLNDTVRLPPLLADCVDQLVQRRCRQSGDSIQEARVWVLGEMMRRGITELQGELSP